MSSDLQRESPGSKTTFTKPFMFKKCTFLKNDIFLNGFLYRDVQKSLRTFLPINMPKMNLKQS